MENLSIPPMPDTSSNDENMDEMIKNLQKKLDEDSKKNVPSPASIASQINLSSIINNSLGIILGSCFIIYVLYFLSKNKTFTNSVSEF